MENIVSTGDRKGFVCDIPSGKSISGGINLGLHWAYIWVKNYGDLHWFNNLFPEKEGEIQEIRSTDPTEVNIRNFGHFSVINSTVSTVEPGSKLVVLGMAIPPLIGNPYNGYINPYYWVEFPIPSLYGNVMGVDRPGFRHLISILQNSQVPP